MVLYQQAFARESINVNHSIIGNNHIYLEHGFKQNASQILPFYAYQTIINEQDFEVEISNLNYTNLDVQNLDNSKISNDLIIEKSLSKEKGLKYAKVIINPFRINGNTIQILNSFDISINPLGNNQQQRIGSLLSYASNSVLSNGNWYKFSVAKAGIYKLDYNFLKQLGISVNSINPTNIRIVAGESGMLPELAGADRVDDLKDYPIKVVTQTNNQFQQGDYILVYCKGPDLWNFDITKQQFKFTKHLYSSVQNLFISVNSGAGSRVSNINGTTLTENFSTSTFDAIDFIEDETENLGLSGRVFVGDRFINQTTKSYTFNFPNIVSTQPLKVWANIVGVSRTSSNMNLSFNGQNQSMFIAPIQQEYPDIFNIGVPKEQTFTFSQPTSTSTISFSYQTSDFSGKAYLDFINVQAKCQLVYNGTPLYFRNQETVATGRKTKFSISNFPSNAEIWDVTNPFDVKKISFAMNGSTAYFITETEVLKEFVAFENTTLTPTAIGSIPNQNLHALTPQDYIIVTRKSLMPYAEEIAQLHRTQDNLRTVVVDVEQVFNEFSSGNNDVSAIRNFVKMLYDKASTPSDQPQYLLLFGDGTYNNRNLGNYYLPTYQSRASFRTLETFTSDDYFGILDDTEGDNIENTFSNLIDIGVGRIPSDNTEKAQQIVAKIKHYYTQNSFGDWRSSLTFVADDEDNNLHFNQAETIANNTATNLTKYNIDKIYLDAYTQQNSFTGATYPTANLALNNKIFSGTMLVNYIGHGGGTGLAQEKLVTVDDIEKWNNLDKLPIFVTATCEFARFDEIGEYSAGERLIFKSGGGAISLLTTTRLVFANDNFDMNKNFMHQFIQAESQSNLRLGDIMKLAKRQTFTGDGNRKFFLLGDPALRLAYPKNNSIILSINNLSSDTLKALKKITLKGEIRNNSNTLLSDFNGVATITIFDKATSLSTLGNDATSFQTTFRVQKNKIYKGKTKVTNGKFETSFIVPKDIDYNFGNAKISIYANSNTTDALGADTTNIIGGVDTTTILDNKGPVVDVFMNDEKFVFGGLTNENPTLLLKLFDENGINTSGNGIGHDITAILDNNTKDIKILNDFYETEVDDMQNGTVKFPLEKLSLGRHTLHAKAWDILNNSGEAYTEFIVEKNAKLAISHILNYPNPFTTKTSFMFEHNKPDQNLDLKIEIFSVSGKLVKTISQTINTPGYRVSNIEWDGRDDFGDKIGRGVYVYKISLKDDIGNKISEYQKLVILN